MFTVVFLSETGVGETIAERLFKESGGKGLQCKLVNAADYASVDWTSAASRVCVFISSSTGDGDPPAKCVKFWRWLRTSELPEFRGKRVAMLGLGDSNYSSYMQTPRRLHKRLLELGCADLLPKTEADDATPTGLESAVEPWIERLWPALLAECAAGPSGGPASNAAAAGGASADRQLRYPKMPEIGFETAAAAAGGVEDSVLHAEDAASIAASIQSARFLTSPDALKTVVLMTFHVRNVPAFRPGDAFLFRCPNFVDDVQFVHARLRPEEQGVVSCKDASTKQFWPHHVPHPVDCFQALSWYVDLGALPSKRLLRAMAEYCTVEKDKQGLLDLCEVSEEGKARYAKIVAERWNFVHVLKAFASCRPPLAALFVLLPVMRPRTFSVASAPTDQSKDTIDFAFTVIREADSSFFGTCSNWLVQIAGHQKRLTERAGFSLRVPSSVESLQRQLGHVLGPANSEHLMVPLQTRPHASFRLAPTLHVPLVMIAHGTGIAPFRAFCQAIEAAKAHDPSVFPECYLFFGIRSRDKDGLFLDEFQGFVDRKILTGLFIAASREKDTPKMYVQDLMRQHAQTLRESVMRKRGFVYVCGDARTMVPACFESLKYAFGDDSDFATAQMKEEGSPRDPGNAAAIGRTCALLGAQLVLCGPLGFALDAAALKRAQLDYWDHLDYRVHASFASFLHSEGGEQHFALSANPFFFAARASRSLDTLVFETGRPTTTLVFGSETCGLAGLLPPSVMNHPMLAPRFVTIPMPALPDKCYNLSVAAGIAAWEWYRQTSSSSSLKQKL